MVKTSKKPAAKKPRTKRDRHLTPVIVTASGEVVAGKRRIARFVEKHGAKAVLLSEFHHYTMIPFLHAAKDDDGNMFLATQTTIDEQGWEVLT